MVAREAEMARLSELHQRSRGPDAYWRWCGRGRLGKSRLLLEFTSQLKRTSRSSPLSMRGLVRPAGPLLLCQIRGSTVSG
jgi:hypothetical protein